MSGHGAHEVGNTLAAWAAARGCQVAWGPVTVLHAVRADLEQRCANGEVDAGFARANLRFDSWEAEAARGLRRVIIIAMPRPAHHVTFVVEGRPVEVVLPPTYERYQPIFEDVRRDLATGALAGSIVETASVPLKPIAARLGLVRYGRNNLAYAPSMGSYLQLLGYLTDARLPVDPAWQPCEPRLLDECAGCRICEPLCPTSAIVPDRVLLHAERCLTLASETAGAWPAWVPLSDLDCLVGCLRCQESCPANPDLPIAPSGVTFTGEETSALLAGRGDDPGCVGPGIHAKFNQLGLSAPERLVVGRNLRALVRPERTAS